MKTKDKIQIEINRSCQRRENFVLYTAMKFRVAVFWVVTTCSDVVGHKPFGGPCCLYLQGEVKMEAA
jgi:hypothetical protein